MKRFICMFLCLSLLTALIPANVYAYDEDDLVIKEVKLKKVVKGWNNHIIYTVNGREFDSLTTNPALNRDAYIAMSSADKEKIIGVFWEKKNKIRQFGTDGSDAMTSFNKATNGMSAIAEAYALAIEKNQLASLHQYYGSAEDDYKYYYKQEIGNLMAIDYGTEAQQILSNPQYLKTPQGEIFAQKYASIEAYMRAGSVYYDKLLNIKTQMTTYALKGTLLDGFNLVRTTFFAPAASTQFAGIVADGFWTGLDYLDYMTEFVADKLGSQSQGVVTEFESKLFSGSKFGIGSAQALINNCKPLAAEYAKQANYAHEYAVQLRNELIQEGPSVLEDIEAELEKQRIAEERAAAEAYFAQTRIQGAITEDLENTEPDTAPYDYISEEVNPYVSAEAEFEAIKQRYDAWEKETKNEFETLAEDFEFDEVYDYLPSYNYYSYTHDIAELSYEDMTESDKYKLYLDGQRSWSNMEKEITTVKLENIVDLTAEAKKYYTEEVGTKLKNFYTAKEIFLADANSELCDILADAKGLDQASNGYTSAENYIKPKGEHFLLDYICINPSAHGLPLAITSSTNVDAAITAKTDAIQEQYDTLLKNYNQYKDELKYSLARYTALQTDYELAWDSCADMLEKMENIADSGFPDYVYTHEMGTPMFLNTDNIEIGASSSQIKNKIQSAASSSGGVQHFLDAESEKIEKKYTEFNDLNTKFEGYYTYVRAYLKEMQKLEDFFVSGEYLFERGINTGSYRPVLELMAESTIIHDEDKEYSGGIFEYKDADYYEYMSHTNSHFNTYPLATEKMAKIAAAKAIMMDFRGSGASHAACLERLGAVKENFGSIMRDAKINGGYTQMYYDYIAPLQSAYSDVINGTYSGIYAEIGKSGKTFYDEIYGEKGVLTMYDRVVQDKWFDRNSYTPVTGITDNTGTTTLALGSGKTAQLSASVLPTDATYQGIIWKSTSPDVASVDANGLVTANASGTAEILAIAEDSEADAVTETVADIEVTNYIYKDKYIVKYTVNVSGADYKDITYLPAGVYSSDEIETSKYLWLNFGTDAEPEYFAVSAGERIVTAKYMPAVGSIDTVLLELYDENGGLLASSKCSNIGNDGSPCVLSAVSPKSADRAVVKLYYDEDCTEFFTEIMDEKLHDNTEHTIGDINFDDVVDSRDAKLLLAFISDIAQPSEMQAAVSDVNGDKTTDMLDVIKIFDIIN